jgi:ribonuclease E
VQAVAPANFVDTIPVGEGAAEAGDGEREVRRRRRRRGGGGRRDEAGFEPSANGAVDLAVPGEEAGTVAAEPGERMAEAPRRERERRDERAAAPAEARTDERVEHAVVTRAEAPARNATAAAPVVSSAPPAMPAVPSFELPLTDLQQLADGAGLQWVHSDGEKVQAVQQAIAAEPKPAHVPRERKPVALADDGPLVLVETRKDLSQLALPFERQQAAQGQPRA